MKEHDFVLVFVDQEARFFEPGEEVLCHLRKFSHCRVVCGSGHEDVAIIDIEGEVRVLPRFCQVKNRPGDKS